MKTSRILATRYSLIQIRLIGCLLLMLLHYAARAGGQKPADIPEADRASLRAAYEAARHAVRGEADGSLSAHNPGQQWRTRFDGRGFTVTPPAGGWTWGLELRRYGFPGAERAVGGNARVSHEKGRVAYDWDATLQEWFVNDARGLEQGFTVLSRPPGEAEGPMGFDLAVRGSLVPQVGEDERGVHFRDLAGGTVVNFSGLKVWDADGRVLPARFETPDATSIRVLVDERGARYPLTIDPIAQQAYLKASNTGAGDNFGRAVAISGDTVVVGANFEDSNATGVGGNQADNTATDSGAVFVFVRNAGVWTQQAYLKASNTGNFDEFGVSVAISGDTVVVGATGEASNATGVNGLQTNNSASSSGAAYVFTRNAGVWTQQAYLKASNTGAGDRFGQAVDVHGDTIIVGAPSEASNATGIGGNQSDNSAGSAGAAYIFTRSGTTWTQQAYVKASNTGGGDQFGGAVALSGDTAVVGATSEDSNATGIGGNGADNSASSAGAAYIFTRSGTVWSQQAYVKASNAGANDSFGTAVDVSGDTVIVGADSEDSAATGVNGSQFDDSSNTGAAYVFTRSGGVWSQQAYLKASNTGVSDGFGRKVSLSGSLALVGADGEDSAATGVDGFQFDDSVSAAGAAYLFQRTGTAWAQTAYLKASNTGTTTDGFGGALALSGGSGIIGASAEDSAATGVNGNGADNSASGSGAAYAFFFADVELTGLTLSAGTLSPAFATATTAYTARVPFNVTGITVTPSADPLAFVTVNGQPVAPGSPSAVIPLAPGANVFTVATETKTYTVTVTRVDTALSSLTLSSGALSPAFSNLTGTYSASVPFATSAISFTPTVSDPGSTVTVNGVAVTSGSASGLIELNTGTNAIAVVVTGQDGITTQTYTVNVVREGRFLTGTVVSAGIVGEYTSLAVVNGKPAISYFESSSADLKYAVNAAADGSGAWTVTTVDSAGVVGFYTSLAVVDGKPAISYYAPSNGDLKYAVNAVADGSGAWTVTTVDSAGAVGQYTSLAVVDGKPAISYYDDTNDDLKYAVNAAADGSNGGTAQQEKWTKKQELVLRGTATPLMSFAQAGWPHWAVRMMGRRVV